ncbi:MAG: hypothetical protein GQ574_02110 [Crocinitomix sp.]|nr:hypothetical protein [Crocinitomix sp.]
MSLNEQPEANFPISLSKAIQWISNWRNNFHLGKNNQVDKIEFKSFLVVKSDFQEIMNNDDYQYVRMYMAVGPNDETDPNGMESPKLIIVGADPNKQDMLGNNYDNINEMTIPCPRMCDDKSSPLYTLVMPEDAK